MSQHQTSEIMEDLRTREQIYDSALKLLSAAPLAGAGVDVERTARQISLQATDTQVRDWRYRQSELQRETARYRRRAWQVIGVVAVISGTLVVGFVAAAMTGGAP